MSDDFRMVTHSTESISDRRHSRHQTNLLICSQSDAQGWALNVSACPHMYYFWLGTWPLVNYIPRCLCIWHFCTWRVEYNLRRLSMPIFSRKWWVDVERWCGKCRAAGWEHQFLISERPFRSFLNQLFINLGLWRLIRFTWFWASF
jgi:hypothetical protein